VKAVVVYQSHWGNTAAVARAIAEGIGEEAVAVPTGEATAEVLDGAGLVVVGSPVIAFRMPNEQTRTSLASERSPEPPDLSQPSMAAWLKELPPGSGPAAAFDTRARGPFGSAAPAIAKGLQKAGYRVVAKPIGFYVDGKYGPMRPGEIDRARGWGRELAGLAG
jgi:hypothetical protein